MDSHTATHKRKDNKMIERVNNGGKITGSIHEDRTRSNAIC